jgi:pyruvate/2-oxoglutarate dehydrogenase complex dihydrolipoamide acyltransferase (E2) component
MSILVGMGVVLFAPLVLLALILTIILSPISLLGIFALIAAWVVGLVALSLEIGKKFGEALNQTWPYPVTAGLGMFILMLFLNGFNQVVPCFGLLPKFVLGMWVLGAVILTRFGTSEYPEADPIESHPADQPPLPAAFEPEAPTTVSPAEVNATKAAVDLAEAEGIDLGHIKGTGANGRITVNDVRNALKE